MENKLNIERITSYSDQVAVKLVDSFFSEKERISGEEIMNFCAIKQVNLFTLKILFSAWNKEAQKLESPYFDYDDEEVQNAISAFKNTVSRYISVDRVHFEPILKKAIYETLLLICSPYHYYLEELNTIDQLGTGLNNELMATKKFTKVNTAILDGLIDTLKKNPSSDADILKTLDDVVENLSSTPEEMEPYLVAFSNYSAITIADIYMDIEEPTKQELPLMSGSIDEEDKVFEEESVADGMTAGFEHSQETTLNEALAAESQPSLADIHEQQKIDNLSKGITLNQRFMFVNVLFDGDVAKFNNTVLEIDGLESMGAAKHYLNTRFTHWDSSGDEGEEFMNVLERRFS
jgi:hypothetical protein